MKISKNQGIFFFLLGCILISVDFSFKQYIIHHIPKLMASSSKFPYEGIGVFQGFLGGLDFSVNHVVNMGGAWGLFSSFFSALVVLRIGVILALTIYLLGFNRVKARQIPLFLILTGATANIIDCLIYGHVVDMFLFNLWGYFFPLFNIADSLIFFGVTSLFFQLLFMPKKRQFT